MEKHLKNGFTLIELLVALAVAAILLGVGIPSFSQAVKNSQISANYNSVAQALYIARSEAVKGSENIIVCARNSDSLDSCGTDWNKGVLVFVDNDPFSHSNSVIAAAFGGEDEILYSQTEMKNGSTLSAWGKANRADPNAMESAFVRYRPTGITDWASGFFRVCDDDRGAEHSKALNIVVTGDIRRGRPANDTSDTPINVFGDPIQCPTP